jgi:hypothetical protein
MTYSADGGSTLSEHGQTRKDTLDTLNAVRELLDVSRELLTKSQRSGILQMSPANLDDVLELVLLLLHGSVKFFEGGQELLGDLDDSRDVHGGGEGIVRGLGHVDVIVGVDGLLGSELAAEHFDSSV